MTEYVVMERGEGKTTALIEWLIGGHAVPGWPGWSRLLVVMDEREAVRLLEDYPEQQSRLWALGNGGLGKLVVSMNDLRGVRGMDPDVQVAVDNADEVMRRLLGFAPARASLSGTVLEGTKR